MRAWGMVVAAVLLLVLVGVLAAMLLSSLWPYVRPLQRPEADIQRTWASAEQWMPTRSEVPRASARTVRALRDLPTEDRPASAAVQARVVQWYDEGSEVPIGGCVLAEALEEVPPPEVGAAHVFQAGRILHMAGRSDAARQLSVRLQQGELVNVLMGATLAAELAEDDVPLRDARPTTQHVFSALAHEAYCFDLVIAHMDAQHAQLLGEGPRWQVSFLDIERERLIHRWFYGELLVELHPLLHDPDAMARALERYADRSHPVRTDSLVARLGAVGTVQAAQRALRAVSDLQASRE
ncbi:MAG: hypothetical protein KTR31_13070 [Myxococcales bacterium]|nr:hypothetical protein [Myxococcales bacterium]